MQAASCAQTNPCEPSSTQLPHRLFVLKEAGQALPHGTTAAHLADALRTDVALRSAQDEIVELQSEIAGLKTHCKDSKSHATSEAQKLEQVYPMC